MKKNFSTVLSIALSIVLIFAMCLTSSAAVLSGEGTKNAPYILKTAEDLDALSKAVANGEDFDGKFIRVESNITASSEFVPIGTEKTPFRGTLDGNGKALSGFNESCDYAAVFAFTDGAVITDLTVSGSFVAKNYAGGIVASAKDTVIENCESNASVYADYYSGGIVGYIESGRISDCSTANTATVGGYADYCGGIAGYSGASVDSCTNNAYTFGVKNVGGIAGMSDGDITSCTNTVAVQASKSNLGGIAGLTEGTIKYSKNTGRITANGSGSGKTGGIAGVAYEADIEECWNSGAVSATGTFTGGIAGYITKTTVKNCIVTANTTTSAEYAGGIFGYALESTVSECIVTATVSAKSSTDAAIGAVAQADISDCYYNSEKETKAVLTGTAKSTKGITTAELSSAASLSALDFSEVWEINTIHASHPLLRNIPFHTLNITSSSSASCTNDGKVTGICNLCNETVETVTPAYGHSYKTASSKAASCTVAGYEDKLCTVCGNTHSSTIPATGHTDADANSECDICKADLTVKQTETEKNIFEKIADFFKNILEWIKNLFS